MATKRPLKPAPSNDITDEWGIYDPAKAGMPALFARLGRPVLQAAPTTARRERRRALRPERSSDGVGMALAEARRRAGLDGPEEHPLVGGNPARALRVALRAQSAVNAVGTPAAAPFMPTSAVTPRGDAPVVVEPAVDATPAVAAPAPPVARRRATRKTVAPVESGAATAGPESADVPSAKARPKRAGRGKTRPAAVVESAPAVAAAPPAVEASVENPPRPAVPAPSPRRPRGPVPLAAWAHAAVEPRPEPRRSDKRGFWRGIFRIPTEVALVEYAHGARIHRLLIEASDDQVAEFI